MDFRCFLIPGDEVKILNEKDVIAIIKEVHNDYIIAWYYGGKTYVLYEGMFSLYRRKDNSNGVDRDL